MNIVFLLDLSILFLYMWNSNIFDIGVDVLIVSRVGWKIWFGFECYGLLINVFGILVL